MLMVALWLTMAPAFPAQLRTAKRSHAKRARHHATRVRSQAAPRSRAVMSARARRRTPAKPATKRTRNTTYSKQKARNIA